MKKLFLSLLVALCATAASAQNTLLATLSHEGTVKAYYGITALKDAYADAVNGDVITLSSGQFNAVDIQKAITVRGAGWDADTITNRQPTVLIDDFSLTAPENETVDKLVLEGIYHNGTINFGSNMKDVQIIKCRLKEFKGSTKATNCSFLVLQCWIVSNLNITDGCSALCINSYIASPSTISGNFEFRNCVIYGIQYNIRHSYLSNCIFFTTTTSTSSFGSETFVRNCLVAGRSVLNLDTTYNWQVESNKDYSMFKTFNGTFDDHADFALTDEAKAKYIGSDGTEVGIYGGLLPYETTPNNPQITKLSVAPKSSADGKLSVDIQIGTAQ